MIDHLPRNSYYSQSVALDEEHAEMLVIARKNSGAALEPYHPPMSDWSQESELLAKVIDEIRALKYITQAVNSSKGKKPKPPEPYPRPRTAGHVGQLAYHEKRQQAHKRLTGMLLPHKRVPDAGEALP